MKRWIIGTAWLAFHTFLVWASWKGYTPATIIFLILAVSSFTGAVNSHEKSEKPNRVGLPAIAAFPLGLAIAGAAILCGWWMAIGGLLLAIGTAVELIVYKD